MTPTLPEAHTPRRQAFDALVRVYERAELLFQRGLSRQAERVAQQVLHIVDPGDPTGSMEVLGDVVSRLEARLEGRLTTSASDGSQRRRGRDAKEVAIEDLDQIDSLVLQRLRWRCFTEALDKLKLGDLVATETIRQCRVCQHPHVKHIDKMLLEQGQPLRAVEDWTIAQGSRVSKSTLHQHMQHARDIA